MNSKLREAFSRLVREIEDGMLVELSSKFEHDLAKSLLAEVKSALAEPRRNCDVGTAEEQAQRFLKFCKRNQSPIQGMCSSSCPCKHQPDMCHCYAAWAQMPYEEGGAE